MAGGRGTIATVTNGRLSIVGGCANVPGMGELHCDCDCECKCDCKWDCNFDWDWGCECGCE
jgi:hypothetical protein